MNIIYLSPHFPPQHHLYCRHLRAEGARTLGIGDSPFEALEPAQRESLTRYYHVADLEDYAAVHRAAAYFIHEFGRIDRVESHNEHWLLHEARLREDFNIPGARPNDLEVTRRKSRMKTVFRDAGIPVARGEVVTTIDAALAFAGAVGYPIVAKPDIGVGASATYKIRNAQDFERFFERKGTAEYFLEEYIDGTIVTYDGLADADGRILCAFSLEYSRGVMEVVNEDGDIVYFTHREIAEDLADAGRRAVKAFDVRSLFFHMEFFRTRKGDRIVALEANLRPPGGYTVDMFNYACDGDLYRAWAQMAAGRNTIQIPACSYHCCFINRKNRFRYEHTHEEILARFGPDLAFHGGLAPAFRGAMGDYAYLVRTRTLEAMRPMIDFIQGKVEA